MKIPPPVENGGESHDLKDLNLFFGTAGFLSPTVRSHEFRMKEVTKETIQNIVTDEMMQLLSKTIKLWNYLDL